MTTPIYLDYNATTPVAPEVLDAMLPYLREHFGNPSSIHPYGRRAHEAIELAREQIASLIGAKSDEIYFTGSATEANNLAILGVARALRERGRHLITSAVEHPSVSQPMSYLRDQDWDLSVISVDPHGRVTPDALVAALREETVLMSVMQANNEVGTVQPIEELAALARAWGVLFHCDAAQSVGKIPVHVDTLGVDLLTIAGHKLYAPKGIGALYIRTGTSIAPIQFGAGHERGLRPGTENLSYIVALGAAAELAQGRLNTSPDRLMRQRDALHARLAAAIPGLVLNGHPKKRLPNTLNLSFPGVSGRELLANTPAVAASVGSACHGDNENVSGVLGAMGIEPKRATGAVRLSLGEPTTDGNIAQSADALIATWRTLMNH